MTTQAGRAPRTPRPPSAALLAAAVVLWIGAACARPMLVETDRAALAAVQIYNESGVTMIVSYEGPDNARATLGAVQPGGSERFIITLPAGSSVRVIGTSQGGERISGPHVVTLHGGTTQRITLR